MADVELERGSNQRGTAWFISTWCGGPFMRAQQPRSPGLIAVDVPDSLIIARDLAWEPCHIGNVMMRIGS